MVDVPEYTKPDVLPIAISLNGVDFTQSNLTYGYFDPFIIRTGPKLISSENTNKLSLHGFGFINPDDSADLKVKYSSSAGDLTCLSKMTGPCI
jgi:hypothetical protein